MVPPSYPNSNRRATPFSKPLYLLAARDPVEHWLVVLVGLLSKVLAVLGAIQALGTGSDNGRLLLLALPNDAVWLVPFALIVGHARRAGRDPAPS